MEITKEHIVNPPNNKAMSPVLFDDLNLRSFLQYSDNIIHLRDQSKAGIYYHLFKRYENNLIYSWCGRMLIAFKPSPSRELSLYTYSTMYLINKTTTTHIGAAHVWTVGRRAINNMLSGNGNGAKETIVLMGDNNASGVSRNLLLKYILESKIGEEEENIPALEVQSPRETSKLKTLLDASLCILNSFGST